MDRVKHAIPVWRNYAACRGMPSEMFISCDGEMSPQQVKAAKAVCGECMVVDDCLTYAITNTVKDGVWGGLSADELAPLYSAWRAQGATVA
ncbi:MAG TPA: WhiB family transcriptional regulator [Acidimicrobiia bacterium]|nr:WhiB family transcriptional regulator [Acidimicrobiia bacterium]